MFDAGAALVSVRTRHILDSLGLRQSHSEHIVLSKSTRLAASDARDVMIEKERLKG